MSFDEHVFLKELKYDDTILDTEVETKPKIKIANMEMCETWKKNKKKKKSGNLVYKSLNKICKNVNDDKLCNDIKAGNIILDENVYKKLYEQCN